MAAAKRTSEELSVAHPIIVVRAEGALGSGPTGNRTNFQVSRFQGKHVWTAPQCKRFLQRDKHRSGALVRLHGFSFEQANSLIGHFPFPDRQRQIPCSARQENWRQVFEIAREFSIKEA